MPDTPKNQQAYPQLPKQQKGLGFPIARVAVLLSLATAMAADLAMGPYTGKETGETALLRQLLHRFKAGDILLADRYYCSYFMIALLMQAGIDFVSRVHQLRTVDFRKGRRLGPGDHIVEWKRPKKPDWMDQETYDRMPLSIRVREVHVRTGRPGCRVACFTAITTLLDADDYTSRDIGELYGHRWMAELDIRAIKITIGLDVLRCKTPEMVRKEAWTCLLAYNLIRRSMLQAARESGQSPRQLSFAAALQATAAHWQIAVFSSEPLAERLVQAALQGMAQHLVGNRPGRIEPRAIKRRPKPHDLLLLPRDQARLALLAGAA